MSHNEETCKALGRTFDTLFDARKEWLERLAELRANRDAASSMWGHGVPLDFIDLTADDARPVATVPPVCKARALLNLRRCDAKDI